MGFMEKAAATIATKYGTVIEGKHKGCVVALGNDPSKKVEVVYVPEQIIFLDGTDEKGRYDISKTFNEFKILEETSIGFKVRADFKDGNYFILELEWKKEDSFFANIIKTLLGAKKADASEKDKAASKYRPIKTFTQSFCGFIDKETAEFLLAFYEKHDILDEINEKFLKGILDK